MKKGLSKFLSLACVFALLMTMALPAFATPFEKDVKADTSFTSVFQLPDGITQLKYDAQVVSATVDGKVYENVFGLFVKDANRVKIAIYGADNKIIGFATGEVKVNLINRVLVKQASQLEADNATVFRSLWNTTSKAYDLYPFDGGAASKKGTDPTDGFVPEAAENTIVERVFTAANPKEYRSYYFNSQGYLEIGNADGAYVIRQESGDQDQILIGFNGTENKVAYRTYANKDNTKLVEELVYADALELYDREYALYDPTVFYQYIDRNYGIAAGKAYYEADGIARTGIVGYNKTEPEYYQTWQNTGFIEMNTGLQWVPVKTEQYGTTELAKSTVWRVYGKQTPQLHLSTWAVNTNEECKFNTFAYYTGSPVSCGGTWIVTTENTVNKDDTGDKTEAWGNLITSGYGNIYLTDGSPKGSVHSNSNSIKGKHVLANVFQLNGKKVDFGEEVTVSLNGVDQKFYIPVAGNGQDLNGKYDGLRVACNYYRYVPTDDGTDYQGITYYNNIGNTYLGWLSMQDKSSDKLMYQTKIQETGTYIIVAGPQYIPEGTDPVTGNKIDAGWYLFDKHGERQTGTGDIAMFGKVFNLKNNVIQTVNGELVSFDNTKVDLNK